MMYEEDTNIPQILRQVRLMDRFFDEVVDVPPYREHHAALHCAYMDLLQAEIAPYALDLALAVIEWEDRERGK
jgi:hypothetical protein